MSNQPIFWFVLHMYSCHLAKNWEISSASIETNRYVGVFDSVDDTVIKLMPQSGHCPYIETFSIFLQNGYFMFAS